MSVTVPGFRALTDRVVALAAEVCGGRLVAMLEGGYSLQHLPLANLAILEGLAGLRAELRGGSGRLRRPARAAAGGARGGGRRGGALRAVIHDAHGHWIADAGNPAVLPPLDEDARADVVVVGGGYTGLWTAWHALEAGADVSCSRPAAAGTGRAGATAAS